MPLVGTICCQTGAPSDFQTCLDTCRGRGCVYPLPLITSMAKNEGGRSNAGISATTISQCPRLTILKSDEDFFEAPSEYHARWRGTGVHAMAEKDGPYDGVIQELRIRKTITILGMEVTISGQPDWYDTIYHHLDDWKSTAQCPLKVYPDHQLQVNIYAWLIDGGVWDNGEPSNDIVETASIVYIDPKRSVSLDVDLWSSEAVEKEIVKRMEPVIAYRLGGELPGPQYLSKKDGWRKKFCPFSGSGLCCSDNEERE